ncbi:unnamed protein product [Durusdinium trenchii]|uniref:RNA helicase n=1 Tax=Durusdinium trenchii TaxID=1381693 RepID=A0ABP0S5M1_9DINO
MLRILAALSAGTALQDLQTKYFVHVPFQAALVLCGARPWADFADLLSPPEAPWALPEENGLGGFFLDSTDRRPFLRKDRLENVRKAGIPLAGLSIFFRHQGGNLMNFSLLDCAILFEQSDCAGLLATVGTELSDLVCYLLRRLDPDPARQAAAMAAARAAWQIALKSEISAKGIAVYQAMKKLSQGRSFPALLVDEVVAFSTEVPKVIKDLDLWEDASFLLSPTSQVEKELQKAGSSDGADFAHMTP